MDVVAGIGTGAVRVFAGAHRKRFSDVVNNDFDGMEKTLRVICDYAMEKNVEIWLETHSDLSAAAAARRVVDRVGRSNLKILWDVMHSIEFKESLEESMAALQGCLAHVHWKDGRPAEDSDLCEYVHTDLGVGAMPLNELLQLLKQSGYDGYVSLKSEAGYDRVSGSVVSHAAL